MYQTFEPRPDWHALQLPETQLQEILSLPPQPTIDGLHKYASSLLEAENTTYASSNVSESSSHKFLSTIMSSGTLEDKVSALTLLVQESPLHTMKAFENLVGLARKKSRNQALMAVAALKDLLGQGVVLPSNRKLRSFSKQPALLSALQGKASNWSWGESVPAGLQKIHLVAWAFEDWLKRMYFELLQILESWCSDEVEYSRSRAITYVWELLKEKPEQEENLLRLLVNKLGDNDKKIASRASYLLLQLEITHPAMKTTVTSSIEADCLFRPGQNMNAKYYAIITLNQTILSGKEQQVANKLLDIYFSLFVQLLKPAAKEAVAKPAPNGKVQGGGGKPGKMAAKKAKANEKGQESEEQLREKMIAQVLTGVNRAFPFADTSDPTFEKQIDTIFRVTHSSNFNTSIQALLLIQQISATKHYSADRFYRTLYESLLDPRLFTSSKQIMYLNLLYKSLKSDINVRRVQAFVKRLLQIISLHEPPFVCGVLYLVSELETTFPSIRNMMTEAEVDDGDGEERFVDVPEDATEASNTNAAEPDLERAAKSAYDPRKRDPEHSNADRSCLWELLPLLSHFHPSVSLFADALLLSKTMPPKPDPSVHTLMHFLDRFVYRNARTKPATTHGSSIMQPMAGSNAADLLIKDRNDGRSRAPLNSDAFWQKKVEDVAADEVFFHSYFARTSKKKSSAKKDSKPQHDEDDERGSDAGEEEIWKALVISNPDIEGEEDDDDLDMDDLESGYSDDVNIDEDMDDDGEGLVLDAGSDDGDELPDLESGDDAMLDDEDDVPFEVEEKAEESSEEELSKSKQRRKDKKKLKQLPTFADAQQYADLLDGDEE